MDSLTAQEFCWHHILVLGGVKSLQWLLNEVRSLLWLHVQQYTEREIEMELFAHLHSLSLRWHLDRKTGEVLRIMDRGGESITSLFNFILNMIVPIIIDIFVAVGFFVVTFNWYFGLIILVVLALYVCKA